MSRGPSPEIEVLSSARSGEIDSHGRGELTALAVDDRLVVQGWVLGKPMRAAFVEAVDGETVVARAVLDQKRPDVAEVFPDVAGAESSGFRMDIQAAEIGRGSLQVRAYFEGGASAALGSIEVAATRSLRAKVRANGLLGGLRKGEGPFAWKVQVPGQHLKVLEGRDGWLFLRNDSNDVLGQHTGRVSLKPEERQRWKSLFRQRLALIDGVGAVWLFAIVPDKESVFPEHLPAGIEPADRRPVHEVLDIAAEADAPALYLLDALEAGKSGAAVYPKTDTHWTYRGAYLGYRAICENLRERGVEVSALDDREISWEEDSFEGDLGSKLDPPVESRRLLPAMKVDASLVFDNEVPNHGRVKVFERDLPGGPSCVVFGESFAEGLLIFLRESFRRLVFVHTSMLVTDVLERERPDVVLSVPIERFLVRLPDDGEAFDKLQALALGKGGKLPWPSEV
jgi:alginate O-acetyltransferase complex protein AlgJ